MTQRETELRTALNDVRNWIVENLVDGGPGTAPERALVRRINGVLGENRECGLEDLE